MSLKLVISCAEIGYGFASRPLPLELPSFWSTARPVSDVLQLICDEYNSFEKESPTPCNHFLNPEEIYLSSTDGQSVDPDVPCGQLWDGSYVVKMKREKSAMQYFLSLSNQSWVNQLHADPKAETHAPNKRSRQVFSGHYVPVLPDALPDPVLVAYSSSVAEMVGLTPDFCQSDAFLKFFSGHMNTKGYADSGALSSWATPYALSIDGSEYYDNCPFKTGNGYGDGRAISIAEIVNPLTGRWELQLKGAGRTPFCRGGDGRSVLRSSVREFLASEAMHHLGVETTRAISLVTSRSETVPRAWFSPTHAPLRIDDPRISHYPAPVRRQIVREINGEPNIMVNEAVAISCRVAPSFLRVGHIELFSRRLRVSMKNADAKQQEFHRRELKMLLEHMLFREFGGPEVFPEESSLRPSFQRDILAALRESSRRIAKLTADWMRVGYCQGNFNSDNCLVSGRTMDYGPFGFIERYERDWNMWSGGGLKYSFRHQHTAGSKNFFSLLNAVSVILDDEGRKELKEDILPNHEKAAESAVRDVYRRKLGVKTWCTAVENLFNNMDSLMEETEADYTIFWRELSSLPEFVLISDRAFSTLDEFSDAIGDNSLLLEPFKDAFYKDLSKSDHKRWISLLTEWLYLLQLEVSPEHTGVDISRQMKLENPKYVPREWMLVKAYTAAAAGNYEELNKLQELFKNPYDDQDEMSEEYYRRTPPEYHGQGGVAVMT